MGAGGGLVARLTPGDGDAAGFGVELVVGAGRGRRDRLLVSVVLEHALTTDATPTLPASLSSWRRLTESGCSSGRPGAGTHMVFTIRTLIPACGRLDRLSCTQCLSAADPRMRCHS